MAKKKDNDEFDIEKLGRQFIDDIYEDEESGSYGEIEEYVPDSVELCKELVADLADVLGVEAPAVVVLVKAPKGAKKAKAVYEPQLNRIGLIKPVEFDRDMALAICHEMRHVWQRAEEPSLYEGYLPKEECADEDSFWLQPAETDANAFATIAMSAYFGEAPLFLKLSLDVRAAIVKRAQEIEEAVVSRMECVDGNE